MSAGHVIANSEISDDTPSRSNTTARIFFELFLPSVETQLDLMVCDTRSLINIANLYK